VEKGYLKIFWASPFERGFILGKRIRGSPQSWKIFTSSKCQEI
jgi:hypothetical protein